VGRAIVQQAMERRSEVIILGLMKKRHFTERAFGGTVDYVIEHAPCEVLVNIVPATGVYESEAKTPSPRAGGPRGGWLPAEAEKPAAAPPEEESPAARPEGEAPLPEWTPPGVSTDRDAAGD